MHYNRNSPHTLFAPGGPLHCAKATANEADMPTTHLSLPQDTHNMQNHAQGLQMCKTNPDLLMLGANAVNGNGSVGTSTGASNVEYLPIQFCPKFCTSHGLTNDNPYAQVDCGSQYHATAMSKEVSEVPMNCVRNGHIHNIANPSLTNLLGHFRNKQGKRLSDVHFAAGNCPQRQKVVLNGNIPQSIQVHHCPNGNFVHRSASVGEHSVDAYEHAAHMAYAQEYADEKAMSGSEKTNSGSNRSEGAKTRWKPNPVQKCILEQYFDSGYTRPTPELHASVQGAGEATENQVTVWLKNRASRCKKPPTQKNVHFKLYDDDSDDDIPWEDFRQTSNSILQELSSAVSSIDDNDVLALASVIKEAKTICSYGVNHEAFTMKAFALNLHHLGYNSYNVGDTNTPSLDCTGLALVSLGIKGHGTAIVFAKEALSAGAKVVVFTSKKADEVPLSCQVIHIPIYSHMHVGADGEVMSCIPEESSTELDLLSLYDRSLELMFECVSIMLKNSRHVTSSEMRARHTNLE